MDKQDIYKKYNLASTATEPEIRAVALPLLKKGGTILEAAELVLGRKVETEEFQEDDSLRLLMFPGLTAKERYGALLLKQGLDPSESQKR